MTATPTLAATASAGLDAWHKIVAGQDPSGLGTLLDAGVVFRSPFVHTPYVGRAPVTLILSTVMGVFQGFRYHRTLIAPPADVCLEFSARVADGLDLKGVDLIRFDAAGRIVDFEVMVRPFKALQALSQEMGARIGPQLAAFKGA